MIKSQKELLEKIDKGARLFVGFSEDDMAIEVFIIKGKSEKVSDKTALKVMESDLLTSNKYELVELVKK